MQQWTHCRAGRGVCASFWGLTEKVPAGWTDARSARLQFCSCSIPCLWTFVKRAQWWNLPSTIQWRLPACKCPRRTEPSLSWLQTRPELASWPENSTQIVYQSFLTQSPVRLSALVMWWRWTVRNISSCAKQTPSLFCKIPNTVQTSWKWFLYLQQISRIRNWTWHNPGNDSATNIDQ